MDTLLRLKGKVTHIRVPSPTINHQNTAHSAIMTLLGPFAPRHSTKDCVTLSVAAMITDSAG